jgi:hypothetical protein
MTKRISLIVVAAILAAPSAWAATAATRPLSVNGSVPVRCKISQPVAEANLNTTFSPDGEGGLLDLTAFVGTDSLTRAAEGSVRLPIACSGAYTLTVTSLAGGLNNRDINVPASGGFAAHVNYLLIANWGGAVQSVETAGSEVSLDLSRSGAQAGYLSVGFSLPAGRGPLVAGTYQDEIVVELNPQ